MTLKDHNHHHQKQKKNTTISTLSLYPSLLKFNAILEFYRKCFEIAMFYDVGIPNLLFFTL